MSTQPIAITKPEPATSIPLDAQTHRPGSRRGSGTARRRCCSWPWRGRSRRAANGGLPARETERYGPTPPETSAIRKFSASSPRMLRDEGELPLPPRWSSPLTSPPSSGGRLQFGSPLVVVDLDRASFCGSTRRARRGIRRAFHLWRRAPRNAWACGEARRAHGSRRPRRPSWPASGRHRRHGRVSRACRARWRPARPRPSRSTGPSAPTACSRLRARPRRRRPAESARHTVGAEIGEMLLPIRGDEDETMREDSFDGAFDLGHRNIRHGLTFIEIALATSQTLWPDFITAAATYP